MCSCRCLVVSCFILALCTISCPVLSLLPPCLDRLILVTCALFSPAVHYFYYFIITSRVYLKPQFALALCLVVLLSAHVFPLPSVMNEFIFLCTLLFVHFNFDFESAFWVHISHILMYRLCMVKAKCTMCSL